jgi:predicted porin
MKKSLFAIAAVTAFAGAAQAQSSVTVYGIIDAGYVGTNTRVGGAKTQSSQFGQGAETTNRLGFRGTEDLGGGTSAFFTVELQLSPQDASLTGNNSTQNVVNRQSFVGLAQKGLGRAAFGTQYTPIHIAVGKTDPGQQNNVTGSVIYSTSSNGSETQTASYTVRQNNALTATSDNFAGFTVSGMYSMKNQDTTVSTAGNTSQGNTNVTSWGLSADYTWKKLYAVLAYQSLKNENPSGTVSVTATSGTNDNGSNVTDNQWYAAATYDFGILKAYANYINRKSTSTLNSNQFLGRSGQQVGVRGFATKTIEGWAAIGNGRYDAYGSTTPTANFTAWQLGSNYWLSKRTNLYAIYGQQQTSSTSGNFSGAGAAISQYGIGARHTF